MSILIESLKRLYQTGKITRDAVEARLDKGTVTQEEFNYIITESEVQE